ncbi:MAG: YfaZ family outer membrane protein [Pseudomonadota bacterium]
MKFRAVGLFLLGAVSTAVTADNLDVNLRDEAIRAIYTMDMQSRGKGGVSTEFGLLYSEDQKKLDDTLYHLGLNVTGENWSQSGTFAITLGGRAYFSSSDQGDMAALAFGGALRFSPVHRVGVGGHVYYAPDITSFMDIKSFRETGVRVDYQILPQAFVYLGYRNIEVDLEDNLGGHNFELDDDAHIGFKLLF